MTISSLFPIFRGWPPAAVSGLTGDQKSHGSMTVKPRAMRRKIWFPFLSVFRSSGGKAVANRTEDEWQVLENAHFSPMIRAFRLSIENEFHMSYSLCMY